MISVLSRSLALILALLLIPPVSAEEPHTHGAAAPAASSEKSPIREFAVPTAQSFPYGLAVDTRGRVWFSQQAANRIGVLDPSSGVIEEYPIPLVEGNKPLPAGVSEVDLGTPTALLVDKYGMVWFVLRSGGILCRFDPEQKEFSRYPLPTLHSVPHGLASGSDGSIWITERNTNKIVRFDPQQQIFHEFPIPTPNSHPAGIALDGNGIVWFAEAEGNAIGRLDPVTGVITEYPLLTALANPSEVAVDKNGNVWFTQLNANALGMLRSGDGIFNDAKIPTFASVPMGITLDGAGRVWFTQTRGNKIAFFDPSIPIFQEFYIPTHNSMPTSIAIDSGGNVWFTENDREANKVAMLPASAVTAAVASFQDSAPAYDDAGASRGSRWLLPVMTLLAAVIVIGVIRSRRKGKKVR